MIVLLRPGLLVRIAWGVDLVALMMVVYLCTQHAFFGTAGLFVLGLAPSIMVLGLRGARTSSRLGSPGGFGDGRKYIRLAPEVRVWVAEPFLACANLSLAAVAVMVPFGLLTPELSDITPLGMLAPIFVGGAGLFWSGGRLHSINFDGRGE
jgi:hypothetical protein